MKKHHLNSDKHLTAAQMRAYLSGELSGAEMHVIEMHLLECGFCAEAMEGLEGMGETSRFEEEVLVLEKRIGQRTQKKDRDKPLVFYEKILALAAAVTLFVGLSFLISNYLKTSAVQTELAQKTQSELPGQKEIAEIPQEDKAGPADESKVNAVAYQKTVSKPGSQLKMEDRQQLAVQEEAETEVDFYIAEDEIQEEILADEADFAQMQQEITGTVFSPDGSPLSFATVYAKDNGAATTTDENGRFTLTVPEETQILAVAFVGMATAEIEISETDTVTIMLEDNSLALMEEVVVLVPGVRQKSGSSRTANMYYETAEPKPTIGKEQYKEYLKDSLRSPQEAINAKIKGKVILRLTIGMDGGIKQVSVVKGLGHGCDEEAIRLIKDGPRWLPGQKNGQVVEMDVEVKVRFK